MISNVLAVRWHHASKYHVQQLVAHPRSDSFVALQNPASKLGTDFITIMRVFEVAAGPRSVRKRVVPYPLRECAFFSLSSTAKDTDFLLCGITLRWSFVLMGDDVSRPASERAREIVDDGSGNGARTLLQDIFGASAIINPAASVPASAPMRAAERKKDPLYALELPAYEQPPLARLFDSIMGRIVGKRALDVPPIPDATQMDIDEPVVESGARLMHSAPVEREPDKSELDALTEMFREVFVQRARMSLTISCVADACYSSASRA